MLHVSYFYFHGLKIKITDRAIKPVNHRGLPGKCRQKCNCCAIEFPQK